MVTVCDVVFLDDQWYENGK